MTDNSIVANLGTLVFSCGDRVIEPVVSFKRTRLALLPDRMRYWSCKYNSNETRCINLLFMSRKFKRPLYMMMYKSKGVMRCISLNYID